METALHDLRVLNTFTFGEVRDVVEPGMVLLSADHFFFRDPEHRNFFWNPANTLPYQALRALQERALVHIAEVLKQKVFNVSATVRRKADVINHRDAVSHPLTVQWRRPEMRAFSDENRKWLDHRPCLVSDMHRSIIEELRAAGEQPELESVDVTDAMAIMLVTILRLSVKTQVQVGTEGELLAYLRKFLPSYIAQLERDPDGRVGERRPTGR
jgi:hypothetical protein